ncbi:RimK family protein [Haliangium sp.]|uniref:RimK family protein n=1 Tax=Haliangium sp. TaxID=2663208 RepID=UPI003D102631
MPRHLLVIEDPAQWNLELPGVEIVPARTYLTDTRFAALRRAKVYNLCRTNSYQSLGYYVSLLAAARGHHPLPSVTTLQDLRMAPVLRMVSESLDRDIQRALGHLKADRFELSVYFGRNLARRYDRLCQALFGHFPAPFLRAELVRADRWRLDSIRPISSTDIPDAHRAFVIERAQRYFARPGTRKSRSYRYDIAILVDPEEVDAPSDQAAIQRFCKAAEHHGMRPTLMGKEDYGRVAEYDALLLRETTYVNHHTYRFARRAQAEGLVVIDDPDSIIRCTNKVYLAELFERYDIPCPKTRVVHRGNSERIGEELGYPVVLKRPDSSFSLGVVKAGDEAELAAHLKSFFAKSELVVAQAYAPSTFDWRIGVLGGRALYACRYYMARGHWQVVKVDGATERRYGKVDTLPIEEAPPRAVALAERVASLIGDGLYGIDLKEIDGRFLVMEINDNPSVEAGVEDRVLKDELYRAIMGWFYERLERRGRREPS